MDKGREQSTPNERWSWLPARMPGVVALMAERRKELGAEWINECWKRGVLKGEPGWFFAGEGGLMVGTLWEDPVIAAFASARLTRTQAVLVLKDRPKCADCGSALTPHEAHYYTATCETCEGKRMADGAN